MELLEPTQQKVRLLGVGATVNVKVTLAVPLSDTSNNDNVLSQVKSSVGYTNILKSLDIPNDKEPTVEPPPYKKLNTGGGGGGSVGGGDTGSVPKSSTSSGSSDSAGIIAGAVVGGVAGVAVIGLVIWFAVSQGAAASAAGPKAVLDAAASESFTSLVPEGNAPPPPASPLPSNSGLEASAPQGSTPPNVPKFDTSSAVDGSAAQVSVHVMDTPTVGDAPSAGSSPSPASAIYGRL